MELGRDKLKAEFIVIGILAILVLFKVGAVLLSHWAGLDPREKGFLDMIILLPLR